MKTVIDRNVRGAAVLAVLLSLTSCDSVPTESSNSIGTPIPGIVELSVTENAGDVTAMTVRISGGPVEDLQLTANGLLFWDSGSNSATAAVLLSDVGSGSLATFRVPDVRTVGGYTVSVLEAADVAHETVPTGSIQLNLQ